MGFWKELFGNADGYDQMLVCILPPPYRSLARG